MTATGGDAVSAGRPPTFERARPPRRWLRIPAYVAVALLLALFASGFVVKAFKVPSPSMEPAIRAGDRILMARGGYDAPKVGDVAVLFPPESASSVQPCEGGEPRRGRACETPSTSSAAPVSFVQRLVAGPGDRVAMRDGQVMRNGRPEPVAGRRPCTAPGCTFAEFTVPAGHWFTLGDNTANSQDGRYWGPLPQGNLRGRVIGRYWPLSRAGGL